VLSVRLCRILRGHLAALSVTPPLWLLSIRSASPSCCSPTAPPPGLVFLVRSHERVILILEAPQT